MSVKPTYRLLPTRSFCEMYPDACPKLAEQIGVSEEEFIKMVNLYFDLGVLAMQHPLMPTYKYRHIAWHGPVIHKLEHTLDNLFRKRRSGEKIDAVLKRYIKMFRPVILRLRNEYYKQNRYLHAKATYNKDHSKDITTVLKDITREYKKILKNE